MCRFGLPTLTIGIALVGSTLPAPIAAQEIRITERPWTGSVLVASGGPVIPIFDGWYADDDGGYTLCFGYYSVNYDEDISIPLGINNFVEPARYDGGQPDYFERIPGEPFRYRRRYCVFPVRVPSDFGPEDRVVWTLRRGREEALSVPGGLITAYRLDEITSPGRGNVAPGVRFEEDGPEARGRSGANFGAVQTEVGRSLNLTAWIDHPAEEVWVGWAKHQGPGSVSFLEQNTMVDPTRRTASTTVRFDTPGRYRIRIQSIDDPVEAFEFHCCWTNAFVEVIVDE